MKLEGGKKIFLANDEDIIPGELFIKAGAGWSLYQTPLCLKHAL
jgi:hypothetical protein